MVHHKIFFLVLRATSGTRKAVEKYAGGMFFRPWDWFAAERYRYVDFAHRLVKEIVKDQMWPVGQAVKTAASHAANGSSILPRVTI